MTTDLDDIVDLMCCCHVAGSHVRLPRGADAPNAPSGPLAQDARIDGGQQEHRVYAGRAGMRGDRAEIMPRSCRDHAEITPRSRRDRAEMTQRVLNGRNGPVGARRDAHLGRSR